MSDAGVALFSLEYFLAEDLLYFCQLTKKNKNKITRRAGMKKKKNLK